MSEELARTIDHAWEIRDSLGFTTRGEVRDAVDSALELLDKGEVRVAEREADGKWKVNQWLKKAVLLSFRLNDMSAIPGGPGQASSWRPATHRWSKRRPDASSVPSTSTGASSPSAYHRS